MRAVLLLQSLGLGTCGLAEDAAEAPEECTAGDTAHSSEAKAKEAPEPVVAELRARALPSAVSTELPQQLSSSSPPAPRPPLADAPSAGAAQAEALLLPLAAEVVIVAVAGVVVEMRVVLMLMSGAVRPKGLVVGELGCCWAHAGEIAHCAAAVAFASSAVADEGCLADVLGCCGHGQGARGKGAAPLCAPELVCGLALQSDRGGLCRESDVGATQLPSNRRHRVVVVVVVMLRASGGEEGRLTGSRNRTRIVCRSWINTYQADMD